MFWNRFSKNRHNGKQSQTARLAHRAVTLARLAALYNVNLTSEGAARLAVQLAGIPDAELAAWGAGSLALVGCPHGFPALFANFAQGCAQCPYNVRDSGHDSANCCALKED